MDARVDGSRVTASAPVSVIPRNWSAVTPGFNVREINPGPLPASPNRIGDLGAVGFRPSAAGFATAIVQIAQGPNQGLHYLVGVPFAVEAEVHVNTIALSKGSAFWTGQPVRRGTNAQGQDLCSRADVVPFQSVVRRHEGIGLDPASHARLYRDELFRRAGPSLEDVVAAQAFQVVGLANTRFQAAMAAAQTESAKADQGSNVPTYCLFSGITY